MHQTGIHHFKRKIQTFWGESAAAPTTTLALSGKQRPLPHPSVISVYLLNRRRRLIFVQMIWTPGLYLRSGMCSTPGFWMNDSIWAYGVFYPHLMSTGNRVTMLQNAAVRLITVTRTGASICKRWSSSYSVCFSPAQLRPVTDYWGSKIQPWHPHLTLRGQLNSRPRGTVFLWVQRLRRM